MTQAVTKPIVLVVDDAPDNIQIMHGLLSEQYSIRAATSGAKAIALASLEPIPDLILLDVMMPEMDGFQTCSSLKRSPLTRNIPIIFVTAKTDTIDEHTGFDLGAVDYITKPISPPILKARIQTHLALASRANQLEILVQKRTQELESTRYKIIHKLGRAAEFRDNETGLHIIRMSQYSFLLAQQIEQPAYWCQLLLNAAPMHDIGKIGIPDAILLKPGKLTLEEYQIIQKHPEIGAEIIGDDDDPLLHMAKEIALYHHERWDGTGYPNKLSQTQIPLCARIATIADVFDALTTSRPYKAAWSINDAFKYLCDGAGSQFDPLLVTAFLECKAEITNICTQFAEPVSTDTAVVEVELTE
ncbi:MAG: HD-GYP domain-containing protein [Shewanella oncorhynchi]